MVFRLKNFFQMATSSIKFRVAVIIAFIAVVFFSVFIILFNNNKNISLAVSRQFYISEVKMLITDLYIASQDENTNNVVLKEKINQRFEEIIPNNNIYRYVKSVYTDQDTLAVKELNQLMKIIERARQNQNNPELLRALYIESLNYPSVPIYRSTMDTLAQGISRFAIDRQIIFFTSVGVLLISLILLQIIASHISKIQLGTHNLVDDNQVLDISQRISIFSKDETGAIAKNIDKFLSSLEDTVSCSTLSMRKIIYQTSQMYKASEAWNLEVQVMQQSTDRISRQITNQINSVNQAAAALEQMERTLDVIFNNISRQSAAMTESAATLEEMGRQVEGVANISSETVNLASKLTQVANKGNQAVDASIISIRDVAEYSTQIIKLLKLITGIAKQTNLLAMNASIEAAHAGEAGRGFAIVAEEIRRLSETTNKNAKEIRTVVDTMGEKIENSVSQAQIAGEDLHQINVYAGNVEERIAQLNNMMQEQNTATHEMLVTIEGLVNLAQEIKISMEEQQFGLHEYSNTIDALRENFADTKSTLDGHMSSVDNLLNVLMDVCIRVRIKKDIMGDMMGFLQKFKLKDTLTVSDKVLELEQNQLFIDYKNDMKISGAINDIMNH